MYTYGGSTSGYVNPLSVVTITGNNANNTESIAGTAGSDYISGLGGNDILVGNAGFDVLEGGLGSDTFVFQVGQGFDTVKDFGYGGVDKIQLPATISYLDLSFVQQDNGIGIMYQGNIWMHLTGLTAAPAQELFVK
jgi:Ca2+-binding RTX toxin-like protein